MNPTELNESNTFAAWQNPLNFASPRFGRAWGRNSIGTDEPDGTSTGPLQGRGS